MFSREISHDSLSLSTKYCLFSSGIYFSESPKLRGLRGWRGSKICVGHVGCVGLQNFRVGRNFGVGGVGP